MARTCRDLLQLLRVSLPYALTTTLLLLLLAFVNPFGLAVGAEQQSKALWQSIYAPYYAGGSRDIPSRNAITVVLIDDAAKAEMSRGVRFNGLAIATMIDDLVMVSDSRPRAIFVDLLLGETAPVGRSFEALVPHAGDEDAMAKCAAGAADVDSPFRCLIFRVAELTKWKDWHDDPRCSVNAVERLRCIRGYGGVPVIFADPGRVDDPAVKLTTPPGLLALAEVGMTATVRVDSAKGYGFEDASIASTLFALSAAAALYADNCIDRLCSGTPFVMPQEEAAAPARWNHAVFKTPIDIIWGEGTRSPFIEMRASHGVDKLDECKEKPPGLLDQAGAFFIGLVRGVRIDAKPRPAFERRCLHTDAFSFALFQQMSLADKQLALNGRTLLIGGALANDNDVLASGPFGGLPEVFTHAMALDNLIQRGADYPRVAEPIWPWFDITWTDIANIGAVFATTLVVAMVVHLLAAQSVALGAPRFWVFRLMLLGVVFTALLAMMFAMARFNSLIPENFNLAALAITGLVGLKDIAFEVAAPAWKVAQARWRWLRFLSIGSIAQSVEKSRSVGES
ncbi:MAG: CHASE2 domain-containing protein [Polymorphobacter sp.]